MSERGVVLGRVGGSALILGSLGFVAAFAYLAAVFGYPDVLDAPANSVLPALAAGGSSMRTAWLLYGAIPFTLLIAGIASMPMIERGGGRSLARFGAAFAVIAAMAMMIGLLRWPSIQWELAQCWADASGEQREVYAAMFDAANSYLGNILGEFVGETMLAGWFVTIGIAAWRLGRRWFGGGSLAMGAIVAISALRQLTDLVDPVSDINNALLPLWLIAIGVALWRSRPQPADAAA